MGPIFSTKMKTYKDTSETQQLELDCPKIPEYVQFQKDHFTLRQRQIFTLFDHVCSSVVKADRQGTVWMDSWSGL